MGNCAHRQQPHLPGPYLGSLRARRRWQALTRRVRILVRWADLVQLALLESRRSPAVRERQGEWHKLGKLLERHPWSVEFRLRFQEAKRQARTVKSWTWRGDRKHSGRPAH